MYKSLGNPSSLPPLFFSSLCSFLSSTGGASFSCLSPSLWFLWLAQASELAARLGGCRSAQRSRVAGAQGHASRGGLRRGRARGGAALARKLERRALGAARLGLREQGGRRPRLKRQAGWRRLQAGRRRLGAAREDGPAWAQAAAAGAPGRARRGPSGGCGAWGGAERLGWREPERRVDVGRWRAGGRRRQCVARVSVWEQS
jgi:hypothetical protein